MSVKQMALVWDLDLAPNKRLVLLAYADHADDDGDNVFPSLGRVAHKTGYSVDQVRRLSRELAADGLMELAEKGVGRGNTHRYRLTLEKGSKLPAFKPKSEKVAESQEKVASRPEKVAPMPPEPSEPSGNHHVEANASSGKPQSVGLEKYIVDEIYQAMKEADFRLPNEHFKYHLGRAKDILEKDSPTNEEIEALPQAFVDLWTIKGKADAHSALMEMRRQKARPDLVKVGGPPPWEPVNPHSPKPPMDPAAYEREKKRREEVAAMLRSVS